VMSLAADRELDLVLRRKRLLEMESICVSSGTRSWAGVMALQWPRSMLSERTCHLKLSHYSSYKNTPPYERVHLCYNA